MTQTEVAAKALWTFTTDIGGCARCGQNHEQLEFKRLERPVSALDFWAACPTNGEPVLLRVMKTA